MQAFFNAVSNYADYHGLDVIFVRDQIGDKVDKLGICAIFRFQDSVGPYQATLDQFDPIPGRKAQLAKPAGPKNKARKAIPGREAEEQDEYTARVKAKISEAIRIAHKKRHGISMIAPPKPSRIDFRASA